LSEADGHSFRGVFLIDPSQKVRIAHINDFPLGRSVDEILRLVDACQFHEKHGEVCPANWKKGAPTMKDNPKDSKSYFEKVNS
jgi:peroxiredoxin (alkyl hydroperoxide reductase subunit C)